MGIPLLKGRFFDDQDRLGADSSLLSMMFSRNKPSAKRSLLESYFGYRTTSAHSRPKQMRPMPC